MKDRIFDGKLDAVAREIRTPAGVTWSALEEVAFALAKHPNADSKHVEEVLGMARLGVQRLLNLAERLTLMSELDAELFELQRYHVDLRDVVREAVDRAAYLAGRKAVTARTTLCPKACIVHIDARWVGAAVLEICSNAFRFARSEIHVSLALDPVLLLIEDDGPGFKQGGNITPGLGTSLEMARRVIDAHGGTFEQRASSLPARDERRGAAIALGFPQQAA